MFEATMLSGLSAQEVLTAAEEMHRAVMERENFILVMACDWADRHAPDSVADGGTSSTPGGESARRFGGEGTPEVLEFAPTELGLPLRISAYSANQLVADALDLRHRLPLLWERVLAGEVEAWKARKVAAATRHLSAFAARQVDEAVAETVTRQSWTRFKKLMDAKIIEADPDLAQSRADREARARYVRTGRASHGMMSMTVRGPAVDVLGVEALVERLARIYAALGDESDLDTRRSKAFLDYQTPGKIVGMLAASEGVDLSAYDPEAFADIYGTNAGSDDASQVAGDGDDEADSPHAADGADDPDGPCGDVPGDADGPGHSDGAAAAEDQAEADPVSGASAGASDDDDSDDQAGRDRSGSRSKDRSAPDSRGGEDDHDSSADDPTADHGPPTPPGPPGDPGSGSGENSAQTESENPEPRPSTDHTPPETGAGAESTTPERADDHEMDTGEPRADTTDPSDHRAAGENSAHNRPSTDSGHAAGPTPQIAQRILAALAASGLDPDKIGPQYTVYAHFASEHLTYNGPVRLEGVGPQTLQQFIDQLDPLARVTVKPVLDLATQVMPVDGYEIPTLMRELHHLTSPGDQFPFSPTTGRRMDIDHTLSYIPIDQGGPPGQTSQPNTGPLARFSHRVRTHSGMTPRQPRPGTYLWRSPNGYICITDHRGTYNLGTDAFANTVWQAAIQLNAERDTPDTIEPPKTTLPADTATTDDSTPAAYLQHHKQATITSLLDHYADHYGQDPPDPTDQEFDDDWPDGITAA